MSNEEMAIISNRMQTVLDLYDRETTIPKLAEKTGLKYDQIQKILNDNNIHHGIKRSAGDPKYPVNPMIFYENYQYLLNCPILDDLRRNAS